MGKKMIVFTCFFLLCFYLFKCQSNSEATSNLNSDNRIEDEEPPIVLLKDTTDCSLLLEVLKKECVAVTSRLNVPTLEQIVILVPSGKYKLDCNQFTLGEIPVSVKHQVVDLDTIRNYKPQKDEPVRKFYTMDYKNRNGYKIIELFYSPSGSIYKLTVKIDEEKAMVDDFFCASY